MSQPNHSPITSLTKKRYSQTSSLMDHNLHAPRKIGILSQTLAPSPHIRWILPARIRSCRHNDIIFVGDSSIQLREFLPNGQLADATARLNFATRILAARVISAKVEKIPIIDNILDQEWDEERFLINGEPCAPDQPPQIVVLCTSASELLYIYAKDTGHARVKFVFAKRSILHGVAISGKYGRHMAVDEESRALAVASTNACAIFSLKHVDELKQSIDAWQPRRAASFQPNIEQRFLPIDGVILQMDFLRPPEDETEKVFLMFIVATERETRLLLYKWDTRESLITTGAMKCSGHPLDSRDAFPLMLWPSARPLSFFVVTDTEVATYDDVHLLRGKRTGTPLSSKDQANNAQLWVQWVKPTRHEQYAKAMEDYLLVREDSVTHVISRRYNPPSDTIVSFRPGDLNVHTGLAICMLPGPRYMGSDILIVSGVGCDGGVFHLQPRQLPRLLQTISNISPLHDMIVLNQDRKQGDDLQYPGRTFALSESLQGEKLSELRIGLEAQIGWTMPIEDCGAIEHLFVVEHHSKRRLYFVATYLETTVVIEFDPENQQEIQLFDEPDLCPGFELGAPTRAAVDLTSGHILQITSKNINVVTDSIPTSPPRVTLQLNGCVAASVDVRMGVFVVACEGKSGYELRIGMVNNDTDEPQILMASSSVSALLRPLCLAIAHAENTHVIVVGYSESLLQILSTDHSDCLQHRITLPVDVAGTVSVAILKYSNPSNLLILTGSRDGRLDVFALALNEEHSSMGFVPKRLSTYHLCSSTVTVVSEPGSTSALIITGSRTARLKLFGNGVSPDYAFDYIWITSRNNMAFKRPVVFTACRIPQVRFNNGGEPSGLLMYTTKDEILFTSLLEQEQMLSEGLAHCKGARHMQYSKYLKHFVAASDSVGLENEDSPKPPRLHLLRPEMIDLKDIAIDIGEVGERVKALINWSPSDGKRHYEMIMIGLTDGHNSRVGHVTAKKLKTEDGDRTGLKTVLRFVGKEVHALCVYGMSSVLVSVGNQLMLLHLDMTTKKFRQLTSYDLPSPAISLSSRGSLVYAATERHSMLVLRIQDNQFQEVFSDKVAKNTRCVLPFGDETRHVAVTTISDSGSSIAGYLDGGMTIDTPTPAFEAHLPMPVKYLVLVDASWSHKHHYCFQGATLDGTIYSFKTLIHEEWKLLHFLERLSDPNTNKPGKRMSLLTKKMARTWIGSTEHASHMVSDAKDTHVNGDVLQRLIEDGPDDLRHLLEPEIKAEDDMVVDTGRTRYAKFEAVAIPVIGQSPDLVAAVVAWTRKLLRSTVF